MSKHESASAEGTGHAATPKAERPQMPPAYGIPQDEKGLLPWSHVTERMAEAKYYWVCTVSPDCRPHATPVDGVWLDDRLYFGGEINTRRHRNLVENPAVCVHLESGLDVVILHGDAHEQLTPERALTTRLAEAFHQKYGYQVKPEDYEQGGIFAFQPRKVIAWKSFPSDVTRWRLESAG